MEDKKSRLAVISTKNPNSTLLECISGLKNYYPEFDIIVVDSDSTIKNTFELIDNDVIIEYAANKNWELGAWVYAYNKYNNYKEYMFIQDSVIPIARIPGLDTFHNILYSFHYNAKMGDGGYMTELYNVYKDTKLQPLKEFNENTCIIGTAHSSFITNNENTRIILQLEDDYIKKEIKKTKVDSWLSERTIGLMSSKSNNIRIDITPYFLKKNLRRDYDGYTY
jgi:hypothetical protein